MLFVAIAAFLVAMGCNKSKEDTEIISGEQHGLQEQQQEDWASGTNPYIHRVVEFCPAPGQFVNVLPKIEEGDCIDTVLKRCTEALANDRRALVSLGGFGGYITFAFDHRINNRDGMDIMIHGNAFRAAKNKARGNSEPGAVMVMVDENNNGLPDDGTFYELKGSGYDLPETVKNYTITYHRPDPNKTPTLTPPKPGHPKYAADDTYIKWTDSQGKSGYIEKNIYHGQSYWPLNRLDEATISYTGTLLTNVVVDESGSGRDWTSRIWEYGYVDNLPNDEEKGFDIAWAIDAAGNPVKLEWIDFVRVYSCVSAQAGWTGEISTEILTAWDLNLLDENRRVRAASTAQ